MAMVQRPLVQELVGGQVHMQHGPIDLVLRAWGGESEVEAAYRAAAIRFQTILDELVSELPELRTPMTARPDVSLPTARRMCAACAPFEGFFITPMAAVAGAVADEILAAMLGAARLRRAFVNDGGDVAVHMSPGESLTVGVVGDFSRSTIPVESAELFLNAEMPVRGIATSGAQGRSFSLGIADSVTVLAGTAAAADAAASLVANAVNLDHPRVVRRPARDLDPDSDLGDRLVTVLVPPLSAVEIDLALDKGVALARSFRDRGLIVDAALTLQGRTTTLDTYLQTRAGTAK
jgi:ApbE superfamily uncharacterized protein (UPF0280 family)